MTGLKFVINPNLKFASRSALEYDSIVVGDRVLKYKERTDYTDSDKEMFFDVSERLSSRVTYHYVLHCVVTIDGLTFHDAIPEEKLQVEIDGEIYILEDPDEIRKQAKVARRSTRSATTKIYRASAWVLTYLAEQGGAAKTADIMQAGDLLGYPRYCCNKALVRIGAVNQTRGEWSLPPADAGDTGV